jgi:hypothetical protein
LKSVDELNKYYELLGVRPGASVQELKTAHRDMAKVWHPDRFAHDPRLQQKAQEKLKEINEAYDQLTAARTGRRPRAAAATPPAQETHAAREPSRPARRGRWQLVLLALLVSGVVFFYAFRALVPPADGRAQSTPQAQPELVQDDQKPESVTALPKPTRAKQADAQKESQAIGTPAAAAAEVRALPTVTVTIDPTTGQLATPACPTKTRMTYPAGTEPHQLCTAAHRTEATTEDTPARPKESRLKSLGKRLKGIISSADN